MKRNKIRGEILFCILLFVSVIFPSMALSADIEIKATDELSITCILIEADINQLLQSLKNDYKSEITIQIQLFRNRDMPYSILGDELIHEIEISKTSEKDFFSDSYIVNEHVEKIYFDSENSFLEYYFNNTIRIPSDEIIFSELHRYYVKIKATLVNKLYIQPFNIFNLINYRDRYTTGWIFTSIMQDL